MVKRIAPDQVRDAYRDPAAALHYARKHRRTRLRRVMARREERLVQGALRAAGACPPVLDAPCGTGRFLPVTRRLGRVVAMDASAEMVTVARSAGPGSGTEDAVVQFALGAYPDLPFASNAFGAVVCSRFLHHLGSDQDLLAALGELARVSHGPIVTSLFLTGNVQAVVRRFKDRSRGVARRFVCPPSRLRRLAAAVGLRVNRRRSLVPGLSALHVVTFTPERPA
jgi:SAM-dependent methyltransferase